MEYKKIKIHFMKKMTLNQMEMVEGGKKSYLAATCAFGVYFLEASFAFPVLFAFTAPLTVSACTAAAIQAAIDNQH
jgi:hypothetical protein